MRYLVFLFFLPFSALSQNADSLDFYIPNIITADCDQSGGCGLEVISLSPIESYHLTVYNRWGNLVFESKNQDEVWRPWLDEKNVIEEGTYVWRLKGVGLEDYNADGLWKKAEVVKTGHLTYLK